MNLSRVSIYKFNLKWLLINIAFFALIAVNDGHASDGETYRLSLPPAEDASAGNNFEISDDGNQTFYLATSTFSGRSRLAAVPTLGGSVVSPTGFSGTIDFRHIKGLEFIVESRINTSPARYQIDWTQRRPDGGGSVNLNIGVVDDSVPTTQLTLSPNKEYLAFIQGGELYSSGVVPGNFSLTHLSENAAITGSVTDFKYAPNGRVFFRAVDVNGYFELFSIRPDGADLRYHDGGYIPPIDASTDVFNYQISPDSRKVVYQLRDGSAIQLRYIDIQNSFARGSILNLPVGGGKKVSRFEISANSNFVVYVADRDTLGVNELFVFSFDGTSSGKLNSTPFAGTSDVSDFKISPDSSRVVYVADQDTNNVREFYSTSIIRNGLPFVFVVKLNPAFSVNQNVLDFEIDRNSQNVYYRANQDNIGRVDLYRVSIDSGVSNKLNHGLDTGENVAQFKLSNDASRVVYSVFKTGPNQLYSVKSNGDEPTLLTRRSVNGGGDTGQLGVVKFMLSPDNETVVFTAGPFGQTQLFAHSFKRGGEMCLPIRAKNGNFAVVCL